MKFLNKYKKENKKDKKERLRKEAEAKVNKEVVKKVKPMFIKCGLNHVTTLIE